MRERGCRLPRRRWLKSEKLSSQEALGVHHVRESSRRPVSDSIVSPWDCETRTVWTSAKSRVDVSFIWLLVKMATLGQIGRRMQIGLALAIVLRMALTLFVQLPDHASRQSLLPRTTDHVKIAHVVSLIVCDKEHRVKGFLDALAILRHSIHQNSAHVGKSKYSYQMVAIVKNNSSCTHHLDLLDQLGYHVLLRDTPVDVPSIRNDWYRNHVENENCCGSAEFIKLYAYTLLQYPIFVHWDLDTAVLQPMDDLFDAMLLPPNSQTGSAARNRLKIQNPSFQTMPDRIDAFFTRDVTSSTPWETVRAVQGGFLVARPNLQHFRTFQAFISEGNYTPGRGPNSGWGGLGYGGFQGAMAYQVSVMLSARRRISQV